MTSDLTVKQTNPTFYQIAYNATKEVVKETITDAVIGATVGAAGGAAIVTAVIVIIFDEKVNRDVGHEKRWVIPEDCQIVGAENNLTICKNPPMPFAAFPIVAIGTGIAVGTVAGAIYGFTKSIFSKCFSN